MTEPADRPPFLRHWTELEDPEPGTYGGTDERLDLGAPFGKALGLTRLGVHHVRLLPGHRSSFPHAESAEEEFVYVQAGTPDAWIDGHVHRLREGDAVGFPPGTGIAHTFINDTDDEVRLIVVGEAAKDENRLIYPLHPERRARIPQWWWDDAPRHDLGPHDGLSARERARQGRPPQAEGTGRGAPRPPFVLHWREVEGPDDGRYPGMDELMSVNAPLGDRTGLTRLGIHHERLPPGRRTSLPHAESLEEEIVVVLAGTPDLWLDGHVHRMREGDAVAFPAGTGIAHTVLNDTGEEVRLLVVGERHEGNRVLYPLHPQARNYMDRFWEDAPERALGPHDGLTAAERARQARNA